MEAIRNYLETMFLNLPNTPEVYKAKNELWQMMEDKYTELKNEGKSENEEEPDNPHFHVLAPIRPFTEKGIWGNKQRREYIFDEDGNRVKDAKGKDMFNAVSTTGWNGPDHP